MTEVRIDSLQEFHMRNPDDSAYALIAHLIHVLEFYNKSDINNAYRNIANILSETAANRILHVMCQLKHVDYLSLIQDCQATTSKKISARLLLHLSIFPLGFVANQLEIDNYTASQLLAEFHKSFSIDSPVIWLQSFLNITEQERLRYGKEKHDLLLGREVTNTPKDTHEARRKHDKLYRLRPDLKFPD
jgi:hypothetical protein